MQVLVDRVGFKEIKRGGGLFVGKERGGGLLVGKERGGGLLVGKERGVGLLVGKEGAGARRPTLTNS